MTARRGERASVVWLHGVIGWGLPAALLWCVVMWITHPSDDFIQELVVALVLFPVAGYVAGRMMWQDRLHAERSGNPAPRRAETRTSPFGPATAYAAATQEMAPTWSRVMQVWWALTWRSGVAMLLSLMAAGLLGAIGGLLVQAVGSPTQSGRGLAQLLGAALGLAVSIIPVKLIVGKNFGEFRLVLLAPHPPSPQTGSRAGTSTPIHDCGEPPAVGGRGMPTDTTP